MSNELHLSAEELEAGLETIRQSPKDNGELALIVRRPQSNEREVLEIGELDPTLRSGRRQLVRARQRRRPGHAAQHHECAGGRAGGQRHGSPCPGRRPTLHRHRPERRRICRPAAGLAIGSAVVEVTAVPHTGCKKFAQRFGVDAVKFVNTGVGKELHLRGINARVVQAGTIQAGDVVRKI